MFELRIDGLRHDPELQIVQGDVYMAVGDEVLIDESVCLDVGLPALLRAAREDHQPNRWAQPHEWPLMPFFVCGCGDPECRALSYAVRHTAGGMMQLAEVDERPDGSCRVLAEYAIPQREYEHRVVEAALRFLEYMEGRDYRPLFADTIPVVRGLLDRFQSQSPPEIS